MEINRKKVLVTGGAGYLGSMLTDTLIRAGHEVTILDNLMFGANSLYRLANQRDSFFDTILQSAAPHFTSPLNFIRGDIRDTDLVESLLNRNSFDVVIHLAAIVGVRSCEANVAVTEAVNIEASKQLIDIARHNGVQHFLFASTYSVYGNQNGAVVDETASFNPTSTYEKSKIAVEEYLHSILDMPWTVFRFATACGLSFRTRFDLLSNQLTVDGLKNGIIEIFQGADMRSFVHVRDIAHSIISILNAHSSLTAQQCFNVGEAFQPGATGYGTLTYSKHTLAQLIQDRLLAFGKSLVVTKHDATEDARNAILLAEKLRVSLGWVPQFSLTDAVDEIIKLLLQRPAFDSDSLEYMQKPGEPFRN